MHPSTEARNLCLFAMYRIICLNDHPVLLKDIQVFYSRNFFYQFLAEKYYFRSVLLYNYLVIGFVYSGSPWLRVIKGISIFTHIKDVSIEQHDIH